MSSELTFTRTTSQIITEDNSSFSATGATVKMEAMKEISMGIRDLRRNFKVMLIPSSSEIPLIHFGVVRPSTLEMVTIRLPWATSIKLRSGLVVAATISSTSLDLLMIKLQHSKFMEDLVMTRYLHPLKLVMEGTVWKFLEMREMIRLRA